VATPSFIFTAYENSFKVTISNLEALSVTQIQEIEAFVHIRKGLFDFSSYSFVIQKRLSFDEFVLLLKNSSLTGTIKNQPLLQKEKKRIGFGQYKGTAYSELPDTYLLWLQSNYSGADSSIIKEEILQRKI
jgi:hypothetical protein